MQDIIIPWREIDCVYRKKHFDFLIDHYSQKFNIILGDNEGEFNRSAARNRGVDSSECEVVVVLDADNYIPLAQIENAVKVAKRKNVLVKPFNHFGYLTEESTEAFYYCQDIGVIDFEPTYIDSPVSEFTGGAYVIKKYLWQAVGGMDEGFIGWGGEDDAFHLICKNSGIRTQYVEGYDYHLYHPAYRVASDFNYNKLIEEYVDGNKSSRIKTLGRQ